MRITIGGALLTVGAGSFFVMGPLNVISPDLVLKPLDSLQGTVSWATGFFKSGPVETAPINVEGETKPQDEKPADENPVDQKPVESNAVPATPVAPPVVPPPITAAPAIQPVPEPAAAPASKSRRRKKKGYGSLSVAKPAAAKPAAEKPVMTKPVVERPARKKAAGNSDKLANTLVSVKLKNGNEVQGVYKSKSAKAYTIELPALGPFDYPIENVVSITPIQ